MTTNTDENKLNRLIATKLLSSIIERLKHGTVKKLTSDKPIDRDKIDSLQLGDFIGAGGFGAVYEVTGGNFPLALKVIYITNDEKSKLSFERRVEYAQFEAEAMLTCSDCENVMHIYDYYEDVCYDEKIAIIGFLMPRAQTLTDFIVNEVEKQQGTHLTDTLVYYRLLLEQIKVQMANALVYLQEHGVIHRDIKPDNIFVFTKQEDGYERNVFMLGDFGSASIGGGDVASGGYPATHEYVAPELTDGSPIDNHYACDVYSLGKTLEKCAELLRMDARIKDAKDGDGFRYFKSTARRLMRNDICAKMLDEIPAQRYQNGTQIIRGSIEFLSSFFRLDTLNHIKYIENEMIRQDRESAYGFFDDMIIRQCRRVFGRYRDYIVDLCKSRIVFNGIDTAVVVAEFGSRFGFAECDALYALLSIIDENEFLKSQVGRILSLDNEEIISRYGYQQEQIMNSSKELMSKYRFTNELSANALDLLLSFETGEIDYSFAECGFDSLGRLGCDLAKFLRIFILKDAVSAEDEQMLDELGCPIECFFLIEKDGALYSKGYKLTDARADSMSGLQALLFIVELLTR